MPGLGRTATGVSAQVTTTTLGKSFSPPATGTGSVAETTDRVINNTQSRENLLKDIIGALANNPGGQFNLITNGLDGLPRNVSITSVDLVKIRDAIQNNPMNFDTRLFDNPNLNFTFNGNISTVSSIDIVATPTANSFGMSRVNFSTISPTQVTAQTSFPGQTPISVQQAALTDRAVYVANTMGITNLSGATTIQKGAVANELAVLQYRDNFFTNSIAQGSDAFFGTGSSPGALDQSIDVSGLTNYIRTNFPVTQNQVVFILNHPDIPPATKEIMIKSLMNLPGATPFILPINGPGGTFNHGISTGATTPNQDEDINVLVNLRIAEINANDIRPLAVNIFNGALGEPNDMPNQIILGTGDGKSTTVIANVGNLGVGLITYDQAKITTSLNELTVTGRGKNDIVQRITANPNKPFTFGLQGAGIDDHNLSVGITLRDPNNGNQVSIRLIKDPETGAHRLVDSGKGELTDADLTNLGYGSIIYNPGSNLFEIPKTLNGTPNPLYDHGIEVSVMAAVNTRNNIGVGQPGYNHLAPVTGYEETKIDLSTTGHLVEPHTFGNLYTSNNFVFTPARLTGNDLIAYNELKRFIPPPVVSGPSNLPAVLNNFVVFGNGINTGAVGDNPRDRGTGYRFLNFGKIEVTSTTSFAAATFSLTDARNAFPAGPNGNPPQGTNNNSYLSGLRSAAFIKATLVDCGYSNTELNLKSLPITITLPDQTQVTYNVPLSQIPPK